MSTHAIQIAEIDLLKLGRSMPRQRLQNGFVKPTGKTARTWTGYWYEYVVVDGQELRRERSKVLGLRSQLTKTEAKDKLRDHIRQFKPTADSSFADAANQYLSLKQGDWSRKNQQVMASLFECHIVPGIGGLRINEIKPTEIKAWLNRVGSEFSYSITHKCLTHVRAVFDQLVEDDILTKNPARSKKAGVKMPKTAKPSEAYLTLEECRQLLKACQTPKDFLIVEICLTCGLRPSEVFALRIEDIATGQLRIDEAVVLGEIGETKTEESNSTVPIPNGLAQRLHDYVSGLRAKDGDAHLFASRNGKPIDPKNYLNRHLKTLGVSAGVLVKERITKRGKVTETSEINFQVLRRTCGTHFQKFGKVKDTQALLRHVNASVTLKHYQKVLEESLVNAVAGWHQELTGGMVQ